MIVLNRQPGASVTRFVDSIWLDDGYQADHAEELHLPDAALQLVIDLRESRPQAKVVSAASSLPTRGRLIHRGREGSMTRIALEAGYFDQAHFTHDFRTFAGMTPSAYGERFGNHMNHVPVQAF